ncbi:hypothetical protein MPTK1_5g04900 [Marchantia polymorpha subsp. ruderalis]|uniref:Uncharacterized protein n=2 Tax=Marchantia polymorpha TaxID=3197 RepID=A0AAF6BF14_MARPO|nr:hypothetical protein MARPO_0027s0137 [Marchantia polymorpha]BBN10598.1 hypothetical protein Mp_5g04900 [Marchantia polymorpha subsp. ruderalis]|eukprot:PTQ43037.1 hypothetical protein MARPO_0027s0137 [Marchantia polymorpha]
MWTCLLYSDPTEEHMERTRMSAIAACTLLRNENDVLFCTETVSLWESMMATARNQSVRWQYSGTVSLWFAHLIYSIGHSILLYV